MYVGLILATIYVYVYTHSPYIRLVWKELKNNMKMVYHCHALLLVGPTAGCGERVRGEGVSG